MLRSLKSPLSGKKDGCVEILSCTCLKACGTDRVLSDAHVKPASHIERRTTVSKKKAAKKAQSKDVAKIDDNMLDMYSELSESGFEQTSADDYAMPFLKIIQKGSPEVDEDDGAYIADAKVGMFIDTATKELFEEVQVIPCFYQRHLVEWRNRDDGGGWVGNHPPGAEVGLQRDGSKFLMPNGETHLSDTRYFFCLRFDSDGGLTPVVVSFASTQIKKARGWMTRMQKMKGVKGDRTFTLPMFANVWKLTTVGESNDQGSWKGYDIELVGPVHDIGMAQQAKQARDMFKESSDAVKPPEDAESTNSTNAPSEDDIPY